MFSTEVKVEGKYVRGTIKKARKVSEVDTSKMTYQQKRDLEILSSVPVPYVFHGNIQKHTGEGQGTWSVSEMMEAAEELEKLRYRIDLMNKDDARNGMASPELI